MAESIELLPPASDGALVDVEDSRDVAIGQFGSLQKVDEDVLLVLVETAVVGLGHGNDDDDNDAFNFVAAIFIALRVVAMSLFAYASSGGCDMSRPGWAAFAMQLTVTTTLTGPTRAYSAY